MPAPNSPIPLINGPLELDPLARAARHRGQPIKVGGRGFDLLCALAAEPGRTVPAADLMTAVWPKADVQDNNLRVQIKLLRRVIGDEAIVSVPRRGYMLALAADPHRRDTSADDTPGERSTPDGHERRRVGSGVAAGRAGAAPAPGSVSLDAFARQ